MYRFNHPDDGFLVAGHAHNPMLDVTIARVTDAGEPLAIFRYSDFRAGGSVCMHANAYAPNPWTREFLWMAFDYPFNQMKVRKVLGLIRADNEPILTFAVKCGFKVEAEVPEVFENGVGLLILGLHKSDCRWLNHRGNKGHIQKGQPPHERTAHRTTGP